MFPPIVSRLFIGSFLLCAGFCCPEEFDFETINLSGSDFTAVENAQDIYQVGDVIYITTTIPYVLPTQDSAEFDLRNPDINQESVGFALALFKKTGFDTYGTVPLNETFLVQDIGSASVYQDVTQFVCEPTAQGFQNRIGIRIEEAGTYQLRSNPYDVAREIYYNIDTPQSDYGVRLSAYLSQSSPDGDFTFTVE